MLDMEIKSAEYFKSVFDLKELPGDNFPQIALAGKSNVGKSSLINKLTQQKKLAQISKTPGKTKLLNFFKINNKFYFVDLPGYGYAKVSKETRSKWGELIENYLKASQNLKGVIFILDIRHPPDTKDLELKIFLEYYKRKFLLVLTKTDKISKSEALSNKRKIASDWKLSEEDLVLFSAKTGEGKLKIISWISDLLSA